MPLILSLLFLCCFCLSSLPLASAVSTTAIPASRLDSLPERRNSLDSVFQKRVPQQQQQQQQPRTTKPQCKATPDSPSWPSAQAWQQLNASTGGRLLRPAPPGAVCHPGQATYDPAACPAVISGWTTHDLHVADPISSMSNVFNNDSCLPYDGDPCSGQGYPIFVVNATKAEHIQLGVKFARKNDVRLVVKGTGHDFIGRSVAPNSLSIWTHHFKGLAYHPTFTPQGCSSKAVKFEHAVTALAGTQMVEAYDFTNALNRTVVGGGGATVGLGGYLTGAGHSLLSAKYGLAADQVLEMTIVSPTGELLVANECQNKDLFWAMRGGGGSTFGVLVSVTMKTYPTPRIVALEIASFTLADQPPAAYLFDVSAAFWSKLPSLGDAGLVGYSYILGGITNPIPGPTQGQVIAGFGATLALLLDEGDDAAVATAKVQELWRPIGERIAATWPGYYTTVDTALYPSFRAWFRAHNDTNPTGGNSLLASRLIDGPSLAGNETATREALASFGEAGFAMAHLVSGKGVWNAKPRGGGNAVSPGWRNGAYVHLLTSESFPPLNATAKADTIAKLARQTKALLKVAKDLGAYMNEANPYEPEYQKVFWGTNYPRLKAIKKAIDPDDVLWCHPCVGNEGWREVDNKLCRV